MTINLLLMNLEGILPSSHNFRSFVVVVVVVVVTISDLIELVLCAKYENPRLHSRGEAQLGFSAQLLIALYTY